MHDVLAALEAFHQKAAHVFDRVEGACGEVDNRLGDLSDRLDRAAARVEAARGSTRPLNVQSARLLNAPRSGQRTKRLFDASTLASLCNAAPLPDELTAAPSSLAAAEDLARVVRCIAAPAPGTTTAPREGRLLPAEGRVGSCSELFLFNSSEQPYRGGPRARYVDNLLAPDEVELRPPSALTPWQRSRPGEAALRLDEDEADPLLEDLRFRPAPAKQVVFELPDVLPDLGGPVADMQWREHDQLQHESERPAWDSNKSVASIRSRATSRQSVAQTPMNNRGRDTAADVEAAALLLQSRVQSESAAPALKSAPPRPVPAPSAQAPPAKSEAKSAAPPPAPPKAAKGKGKEAKKAAPPPPAAKSKGKGKGKGKGGPPPPAKGGAAPPPKAKAKSGGGASGKAEMFAAIQKSGLAGLRKASHLTKEKTGAPQGRVL